MFGNKATKSEKADSFISFLLWFDPDQVDCFP